MRKIQKTGNRALSIIMSLVMLVSVFPLTALAADEYTVTLSGGDQGTLLFGGTPVDNNSVEIPVPQGGTVPSDYTFQPASNDYLLEQFKIETDLEVVSVFTGTYETYVIASDGNVYGCGRNNDCVLGIANNDGQPRSRFTPMDMTALGGAKAVQVARGSSHTLVLADNGKVYGCGDTRMGELGFTTAWGERTIPTLVEISTDHIDGKVIAVDAGQNFSVVLTDAGKVYGCGTGSSGQFGQGAGNIGQHTTLVEIPLPENAPAGSKVQQIATGNCSTVVLTNQNEIYSTGSSTWHFSVGDDTDSHLYTLTKMDNSLTGTVDRIEAGWDSVLVYGANGVFICGQNVGGSLGVGDTENRTTLTKLALDESKGEILQAATGSYNTVVYTTTGVYICGSNNYGQFGTGANDYNDSILDFQKVNITLPQGVTLTQIACSNYHFVALGSDGKTYGWGYGNYGQLGNNSQNNYNAWLTMIPPAAETYAASLSDIQVTKDIKITAQYRLRNDYEVTISGDTGLAVQENGVIAENNTVTFIAQEGFGIPSQYTVDPYTGYSINTIKVDTTIPKNFVDMVSSYEHTVLLTDDNELYACGNNTYYQLGVGDKDNRNFLVKMDTSALGDKKIKKILNNDSTTFVMTEDGSLYACGLNAFSRFATNDVTEYTVLTEIDTSSITSVTAGDGTATTIVDFGIGISHTVVLTNTGKAYACGSNNNAQLGIMPSSYTRESANWLELKLPTDTADADEIIEEIAINGYFNLLLTNKGRIYGNGDNSRGQLGYSENDKTSEVKDFRLMDLSAIGGSEILDVYAGDSATMVVTTNGLYACGYNYRNRLGFEGEGYKYVLAKVSHEMSGTITDIAIGGLNTLITCSDTIYAVGSNTFGQMANGKMDSLLYSNFGGTNGVTISLPQGVTPAEIETGDRCILILGSDGRSYAAGCNIYGQMCYGEVANFEQRYSTLIKMNPLVNTTYPEKLSDVVITNDTTITMKSKGKMYNVTINAGDHGTISRYAAGGGTEEFETKTFEVEYNQTIGSNYTVVPDQDYAFTGEYLVETKLDKMVQVSKSDGHTLALSENGEVYAAGYSTYGQLGNTNVRSDVLGKSNMSAFGVEKIKMIAAGSVYSLALTESGKLFGTGRNLYSCLTLDDSTDTHYNFIEITIPSIVDGKIVSISAGDCVTALLTDKGKAYVGGSNRYGQFGVGDEQDDPNRRFVEITLPEAEGDVTIKKVVVRGSNIAVLASDNMVYTCGENYYGACGIGSSVPQTVTTFTKIAWDDAAGTIQDVYLGTNIMIVLAENGTSKDLYACGKNNDGQIGAKENDRTDKYYSLVKMDLTNVSGEILDVAAGTQNVYVHTTTGVYGTGRNSGGALGLGERTPEKVWILQKMTTLPEDVTPVSVSAGAGSVAIIGSDGLIYTCGSSGTWGDTGLGESNVYYPSLTPIKTLPNTVRATSLYAHKVIGETTVTPLYSFVTSYSIDITWGSMEFTYSDGTWNTQTHEWSGAGWEPDAENANRVSITNNSNVPISAEVTYTQNTDFTGIEGTITDGTNPVTDPATFTARDDTTQYFYLGITGALSERIANDVKSVGTVKIVLQEIQ